MVGSTGHRNTCIKPSLRVLPETLATNTDYSGASLFDPEDIDIAGALFVIACDNEPRAVGCGAYGSLYNPVEKIKRMIASRSSKGVTGEYGFGHNPHLLFAATQSEV
jgi:hypothetical protein